jgi:hypothetical protein
MSRVLDCFSPAPLRWDAAGLVALRALIVLHAAVRSWAWVLPQDASVGGEWRPWIVLGVRLLLTSALVAALRRRLARFAVGAAAVAVLVQVVLSFPTVGDHVYLELAVLFLFAIFDARHEDDGQLLRSLLCWMGVIVLFHSGLQKLLHGYYFVGALPLWAVAAGDPFGRLFAWALSGAEVSRLIGLNLSVPEAGPFLADGAALLTLANAVWAAELILVGLIVAPSTRRAGVISAVLFLSAVYGIAREPMFALLLVQLLLLCVPGQWNRRLAPCFLALYAAILLCAAGVFPGDLVLREGRL